MTRVRRLLASENCSATADACASCSGLASTRSCMAFPDLSALSPSTWCPCTQDWEQGVHFLPRLLWGMCINRHA